jgi:hypothetical protein
MNLDVWLRSFEMTNLSETYVQLLKRMTHELNVNMTGFEFSEVGKGVFSSNGSIMLNHYSI